MELDLEKEIVSGGKDYVTSYDMNDPKATFVALSLLASIRLFCDERNISVVMTKRMISDNVKEITAQFINP